MTTTTITRKLRKVLTDDVSDRPAKRTAAKSERDRIHTEIVPEDRRLRTAISEAEAEVRDIEELLRTKPVNKEWRDQHAELRTRKAALARLVADRAALQPQLRRVDELERQLRSHPLASPELLIEQFVNDQEIFWLGNRQAAARREQTEAIDRLARADAAAKRRAKEVRHLRASTAQEEAEDARQRERLAGLQREVDRWSAELSAATAELEGALERREEIRAKIINE